VGVNRGAGTVRLVGERREGILEVVYKALSPNVLLWLAVCSIEINATWKKRVILASKVL